MGSTVAMLNILLFVILGLVLLLGAIAVFVILSIRKPKDKNTEDKNSNTQIITRSGVGINSIFQFMEFDCINNNMIIRKNRKQYVMVIDCKGINYDLLSEVEKEAVEVGFTEVLNTLRYPIQLYVQTRTFDLTDLLDDYQRRIEDIEEQITRIDSQIEQARLRGDDNALQRLMFEKKRRINIFEYGQSIQDYTSKITENANILQQKTYLIVSYYIQEYGDISKYSKAELDDIAFSELYTRAQTIIRALTSAEVSGRVISSEELAELLYVAYNRDESEIFTLKNALNSEYDRLYSTAKDVLEQRKERLENEIENAASELASQSILKADEVNRQKRAAKIKMRAKQMVEEYREELSNSLFEETNKQIDETMLEGEEKRVVTRSRARMGAPIQQPAMQQQMQQPMNNMVRPQQPMMQQQMNNMAVPQQPINNQN